jgi:hypothetical protein
MSSKSVSVNEIKKAIKKHNDEYNKKLKVKILNDGSIEISDNMPKVDVMKQPTQPKSTKENKPKTKVDSSMTGKQYLESLNKKVKDLSKEEMKEYEKLRKRNYRMRKNN